MTDIGIITIINSFNKPQKKMLIASHPIGTNIDYGLVWPDDDFHNLGDVSPYKVYFIKSNAGKCVGAVLDMTSDLHWLILPKERKKGYLVNALKNEILPHLSRIRKEQRITINRNDIGDEFFEASKNTATKAGFKIPKKLSDKIECKQKLAAYKLLPLTHSYQGMTFEHMADIRKDMNVVVGNLWKIKAEVEMKLGSSHYTRKLAAFIEELGNYRIYKLDDALYDFEERKEKVKKK